MTSVAWPASRLGSAQAAGQPGLAAAGVPAGFQPDSASFVSAARGFVLGTVGCRPRARCRARLVRTIDGGAHWRFRTAPDVLVPDPARVPRSADVSSVIFAGREIGWLFGPGLWVTRDGAAHWRRLRIGGRIVRMAEAGRMVYAVVTHRDRRSRSYSRAR